MGGMGGGGARCAAGQYHPKPPNITIRSNYGHKGVIVVSSGIILCDECATRAAHRRGRGQLGTTHYQLCRKLTRQPILARESICDEDWATCAQITDSP